MFKELKTVSSFYNQLGEIDALKSSYYFSRTVTDLVYKKKSILLFSTFEMMPLENLVHHVYVF